REEMLNKESIVFSLPHTHGALSKVLTIFSFYDINLSKIQSMPLVGREWEYRFYVDLTYDSYFRYRQSIEAVRPLISDLKILGEYREYEEN
ncbi:MAG: prephenate dehydratase, partial [Muribaculaceae bacterium]|nr:prephenate dehydratase [Muribaculaceae bacterium]